MATTNEIDIAVGIANTLRSYVPETVPQVTGLRLARQSNTDDGVICTLTWLNPEDVSVDHYEVYAGNLLNSNVQPLLQAVVTSSPAEVRLNASQVGTAVLKVQVVLTNGQRSSLDNAPSVAPSVTMNQSLVPLQPQARLNPLLANPAVNINDNYVLANINGVGTLKSIREVMVAINYGVGGPNTTNLLQLTLSISIDYSTPTTYIMYLGTTAGSGVFHPEFLSLCTDTRGAVGDPGTTVGDFATAVFDLPFTTNLRIEANYSHYDNGKAFPAAGQISIGLDINYTLRAGS